jgi:hypothetical protein
MIRQSFQNIVNPENIIENFASGDGDADNTTKYYELISNMDSQCDVIIDEMDISNFSVSDDNKCVTDGRTYAKSDKDYVTLRRENLNRIEVEYSKINGETTLTDFEKNSQLLCIMNKLFYNIKQVTENNDEMSKNNLEKENLARENEHLIEKNREIKKKDKDLNLVTNANVIGSKESQRQIQTQYIIFMVLIAIFLIIQVVLFFV